MANKEPIKISLPIFILSIVMIIGGVFGCYVYMQNQKLDKEIANLREDISKSQKEKNDLQEQLNNASTVSKTNNENDKEKSKVTETDNNIVNKLKQKHRAFYITMSNINLTFNHGGNDACSGDIEISNDGKVSISEDVVCYLDGTYKIDDNIITCSMKTLVNMDADEKEACDYMVKFKILNDNVLEVISSDLKDKYLNKDIYSIGELLIASDLLVE